MRVILIFISVIAIITCVPFLNAEDPKIIKLPDVQINEQLPLEEAISLRRSVRDFDQARSLKLGDIGNLLWAASGITDEERNLRSAPSAGALYPLEIYIVKIEGLYLYEPPSHSIREVKRGDLRKELCRAALNQYCISGAPASLIIVCDYSKTTTKYGQRGKQYVHIEAGHVAQNIHLEAVSLGLGSVPIGAFSDDEVRRLLNLDSRYNVLYLIPVGYPADKDM